jgi:Protein of unknown function (DUF2786)/SprT-like family
VDDVTALLEASLLRELRLCYEWENEARFRNRLVAPVLVLSDAAARLGRWVPQGRTIELSRKLVFERTWPEITGVLLHEMAHQFVHEVLRVHDETSHGDAFQKVCADRGIDAAASGVPTGEIAPEIDKTIDRIRKLLALAGSSNQHEAEIAMRKAHELMLRHNIETTGGDYEVRHLGDPEKRVTAVEQDIAGLLAEFFFVKVIRIPVYLPRLGKRGHVFEIVGTRANVEMASHVYAFLLATADRLWRDNRADARVRSGRDRNAYQTGVIGGFRDKLAGERKALKGTGLVWVGDASLDRYYRARHPRITTRTRMVRLNGAHSAGREAGRRVVLHKPVENGPSGGPRRLLRG